MTVLALIIMTVAMAVAVIAEVIAAAGSDRPLAFFRHLLQCSLLSLETHYTTGAIMELIVFTVHPLRWILSPVASNIACAIK